jgi:UDP-N-acetylmuramyl tripeptide synthase
MNAKASWTLKDRFGVLAVRLLSTLIHWSGRGSATSLPGKLALRWHPDFLKALGQSLPPCVMLTGTNGKTTTATLLRDFFEADGRACLLNERGANLIYGITTRLAQRVRLNGTYQESMAVLETDEATVKQVAPALSPEFLTVSNLFRDQLDRYGELSTTARFIEAGLSDVQEAVFLNADDPLVVAMAREAKRHSLNVYYFGVEIHAHDATPSPVAEAVPHPQEVVVCPECGAAVSYHSQTLAHLGDWYCMACGTKRPPLDVKLRVVPESDAVEKCMTLELTTNDPHATFYLQSPLEGIYNAYNVAQAVTIALHYGVTSTAIQSGLSRHQSMFGRAESRTVQGKLVKIMLIKNPAGASEILKLVSADSSARVLVLLNDSYADGEDVSWIWDADFERLLQVHPKGERYVVGGSRAFDMANRLKYASMEEAWHPLAVQPDIQEALDVALASVQANETLYILPTYTALLALEGIWNKS